MDLFMSLIAGNVLWAEDDTRSALESMHDEGLLKVVVEDAFGTGYMLTERGEWQQAENRQNLQDEEAFDNSCCNK